MIEPIMYFGIGFLVATLLGLLFVPLVHNRAVRLTMRRLEAATPLSVAEIRADKDQLRAEFAMSTRRLEINVDQMKAKTTTQLAELGKKADAVNQLKKELGEKTTTVFTLESRDKALRDQLRAGEEELTLKSNALREAERTLSNREAELAKLLTELDERSTAADGQRVELASLRTQVEAMKVSVADYEYAVKETQERLARERTDAATVAGELKDARSQLETLAARAADLERQLIVQTTEAEILSRRVQELEVRLGEQGRVLAERESALEQLRSQLEAAQRLEGDLREELAAAASRGNSAAEKFRGDLGKREAQLAVAAEERAKLQRELVTMKHEAESTWAAERVENALLRERINDVAAEVARLTAALEGPDSPIDAILADEASNYAQSVGRAPSGINGSRPEADAPRQGKGSLADRIRALQSSASRAASN